MTKHDEVDADGLPQGWTWTTLGEVADINPPRNIAGLAPGVPISFVPMAAVEAATGQMNPEEARPWESVQKGYTPFQEGDILFAKITPCMENGKCAIARGLSNERGAGSTEFHVFRPHSGVDTSYLLHFLLRQSFRREMRTLMQGAAGQLRVPESALRTHPFPLPPLPEQARIVAEIEQRFSLIDAGVASLKRAQANLKRYRASVLQAACTGRLVPTEAELARAEGRDYEPADVLLRRILTERRARWEADQWAKMTAAGKAPKDDRWKARYEEPKAPAADAVLGLPEGWEWITMGQLAWHSGYGTSEKCDYDGAGIPVLRIPNIAAGRIDLADMKRALVSSNTSKGEELQPHDLLIIRTNGSRGLIGRAAVVRQVLSEAHYFASYLIRYRLLGGDILAAFISTVWHAPSFRVWIESNAATSAGQYNISMGSLNGFAIPLPPLAEQQRIVAEVERRLSVTEHLEAEIAANLKRAERLKQSILRDAFAGRLVAQDPTDEPASLLLERIRAERDVSQAARKRTNIGARQKRDPQAADTRRNAGSPPGQGALPLDARQE